LIVNLSMETGTPIGLKAGRKPEYEDEDEDNLPIVTAEDF